MSGPMSEQSSYYPYWDRVVIGAVVFGGIVVVELAAIIWRIWRG